MMEKYLFTVTKTKQMILSLLNVPKLKHRKTYKGVGHKQTDQDYSQNRMCGESVQIF